MPRRPAKVIVDPAVPRDDADFLRSHHQYLAAIQDGWLPRRLPPPPPAVRRVSRAAIGLSVAAVAAGLLLLHTGHYGAFVPVILIGAALLILAICLRSDLLLQLDAGLRTSLAFERAIYDRCRKYDGRYVLRARLDPPARALLARARAAVGQVMRSRVNAEGLLDSVRNGVMLPAQEWEIARLLAKLSALRAEHQEVVAEGVTPEVEAVAAPLARALADSEAAVIARVEALERYAGHVADADRAYRARHQIERLNAKLPRYEELLAETGADGSAVPELTRLSDDADHLEQALRDSVSSAHEAFRHLLS